MRNLWIGAALVVTAVGAFMISRLLAEAGEELAGSPLWPRPDGSVHRLSEFRSFGEIWDWTDAA